MQTQLSPEYQQRADGRAAEAILRKCVHCGFCTATCPTYQLLGDELDGPRGRIYLMKQVLEGAEPTRKTQLHLDRCLTCRNCESTCPSGVDYGHLVDIGRQIVDEKVPRPLGEKAVRWLLKEGLTSPRFAPAMKLGQAVRPLLPGVLKDKVPAPRAAGALPTRTHARRVLAGSLGTLGVITEVSLKVLPMAPAEATLVFPLGQHEALEQLHRWGGQPLPINASRWAADRLTVRLRGAVAAVEAAVERMAREAGGTRLDPEPAGREWADCRDQRLPFFQAPTADHALWRLSVPQTAPVLDLPWAPLIEWQGAQRWLWAPASAAGQIRAATAAVNGHATLFRAGADGAPGVPRFDRSGAAIDTITQRLRAEFDPAGLFTPGRMG